nr:MULTISPECIES: class A beta-lactamase [unclassified Haematospirillum]
MMQAAVYSRRSFLKTVSLFSVVALSPVYGMAAQHSSADAVQRLSDLEGTFDGRLGVFAFDTGSGASLAWRSEERFPVCSTFKAFLAAAILHRSTSDHGLLDRVISYPLEELVSYSPVTQQHVHSGMRVRDMCAAAIQYSDNTAANLLMRILGGPDAVTTFMRQAGDTDFRLDRWETDLNTAIPGDLRDTSTPVAIARSLDRLLFGDVLSDMHRAVLQDWLKGNTTGASRIRAGVPEGWMVGDRTGSGSYGTANAIGVLWPPGRKPVIASIYTTQHYREAVWRDDIVAQATRIIVDGLA